MEEKILPGWFQSGSVIQADNCAVLSTEHGTAEAGGDLSLAEDLKGSTRGTAACTAARA